MTSWSAVAGQLTMPGSSINDKSGLELGISTNTEGPCLTWDLEKTVLHEIRVSGTVVGPLLTQKSPTCT